MSSPSAAGILQRITQGADPSSSLSLDLKSSLARSGTQCKSPQPPPQSFPLVVVATSTTVSVQLNTPPSEWPPSTRASLGRRRLLWTPEDAPPVFPKSTSERERGRWGGGPKTPPARPPSFIAARCPENHLSATYPANNRLPPSSDLADTQHHPSLLKNKEPR